jgi:competence protein ComEA
MSHFPHNVLTLRKAVLCGASLLLLIAPAGLDAKQKLPDGPGKEINERLCGSCHAAELVMGRRESREGWNGVVADMVMRGAEGTNEEFGEVVDYLVAHFSKDAPPPEISKLNVNKAKAADLAEGLEIPAEQAAAIVRYREEKGIFKSVEDLRKVPGLDSKAIEAKKNEIEF